MNLGENPILEQKVESDNELKTWLVNYVGDKCSPEDGEITVEMIVDTLSEQFPEFLMAVAEENWIRGYHQALEDATEGEKAYKEEVKKVESKLPRQDQIEDCDDSNRDEKNG